MKTVQATKAKGSPRQRVCGESTAKMHWYQFRSFAGFMKKQGLVEDFSNPANLLKDKKLLDRFYQHVEEERVRN